jgi:hypothetical protein
VIDISTHFGVEAKVIGRVEKSSLKQVTVIGEHGEFQYR